MSIKPELYISKDKIWWNKGNEIKPTQSEFDNIIWTAATNFNVNYISEFEIDIICPTDMDFDLVYITQFDYDKKQRVKDGMGLYQRYYYLTGILNNNGVNKTCRFELDLWCTFFLSSLNYEVLNGYQLYSDVYMNRSDYLNKIKNEGVSLNVLSLSPIDIVSRKRTFLTTPIDLSFKATFYQSDINTYYITNEYRTEQKDVNMRVKSQPLVFANVNGTYLLQRQIPYIYFVFNVNIDAQQEGRLFIIPVLWNCNKQKLDTDYNIDTFGWERGITSIPVEEKNKWFACNNNEKDLGYLTASYSKYFIPQRLGSVVGDGSNKLSGPQLGELLGVFLGPNPNRINKTAEVVMWKDGTVNKEGSTCWRPYEPTLANNIKANAWEGMGGSSSNRNVVFIGWTMTNKGLPLLAEDSELTLQAIEKGLSYYNNELSVPSHECTLYFTNSFVYSRDGETLEDLSDVPFYTNSYATKVINQFNSYNTAYQNQQFTAGMNGLLGIAGAAGGAYNPGFQNNFSYVKEHLVNYGSNKLSGSWTQTVGKNKYSLNGSRVDNNYHIVPTLSQGTTKMAASFNPISFGINAATSAISTGIQLSNNYKAYKATIADMKATMGTVNTTNLSRNINVIQNFKNPNTLAVSLNKNTYTVNGNTYPAVDLSQYKYVSSYMGYEITYTPTSITNWWFTLYGYNDNFRPIGKQGDIRFNNKTVIRQPKIAEMILRLRLNNAIPPFIIDMIWEMISNGVICLNKNTILSLTGE